MGSASKNPLYIVGAGDFGRELLEWGLAVPASARDWEFAGFLDSRPRHLEGKQVAVDIVGDPDTWKVEPHHRFVCSIGDPKSKMEYVAKLAARGAVFENVIHPTALVGTACRLGRGIVLCPYVVLTTNVAVEDHVHVNCHTCVGHDAFIGEGATLSPHTNLMGHGRMERGSFTGANATVLPGALVGEFALVGAGSVVVKNAPAHTTVVGVPAKPLFVKKQ